ncbi:hypothetical protein Tco_1285921 [Tanacetum coccineum]
MIDEEGEYDTESEDIIEAEKKFKMLAKVEEVARNIQEEWETEEEKKIFVKEEVTKDALTNEYDFIQARLNADKILAEKLQEEERDHVGGKKHSDLKTKSFEEIQVLYEKIKRSDDNFIAIGSAEDERVIKEMNEQVVDLSKKRVKKDDSIKEESKEEAGTRKRKLGTRKKMKSRKRRYRQDTSEGDSEKENDELRLCLTIAPDEDKEVDYEILDKKHPIIEWRSEYLTTKPQYDETKELEDVYLNVVIRSNGQRRYFSTLMTVLSIFDREDLNAVYQFVMDRHQDDIPEGFDRILWGDLMIMSNQSDKDEFWNTHQDWKVVSWKLHSSSGLKLESEEDSTMALELIRFVKKHIAELEPENSDGDEEDL